MKNKVLLAVIIVLVAVIALLAWLNGRSVAQLEPATLVVKENGQETGSISLEEITSLEGVEEFSVVLRSSGKDAVENRYTGIALARVLEAAAPGSLTPDVQVSVKAIDGYAVAYAGEEALRDEHLFLVWLKDGKPLGNKTGGGSGPLMVIPRQDEFGQYWCKFVVEVDLR